MLSASSKGLKPQTVPEETHKNLGGPARVIASTILIFLFSQLIAAFIAGLLISLFNPHTSISLDNSIAGQFFYILMAEGLAAYFTVWLVKRRGLGLGTIGLGRRPKPNDLVKAAIGFAVFYAILILVSLAANAIWPNISNEKQDIGFNNIHNGFQSALAFISLVLLPPLGEEVLVRGYLYSGLRLVWRFMPAMLVTSLFFATAHLEFGSGGPLVWAAALDTFVLSIVLVFLREKTGALYAGILVHMLNNLIAFGVHFHS